MRLATHRCLPGLRLGLGALLCLWGSLAWAVASLEVSYDPEPGVRIAATLELPESGGAAAARAPVVVLAVGAGPWGRGGYGALRQRLHAAGIATLSYDKRGFGGSTGAFDESLPVVSRDIVAAVAYLRSRADIDGQRIALLGHSQGGGALPLAAATSGGIAGVVVLAAPIGARGEVFGASMRQQLVSAGMPAETAGRIVAATSRWMEGRASQAHASTIAALREAAVTAFRDAGWSAEQAQGAIAALDNPMLLSMYDAPLDKDLLRSGAPVLAVYGGADTIVSPDVCVPAASRALAGHRDALVLLVPGMPHGLDRTGPVPPPRAGAAPEDAMSPVLVSAVHHWLVQHLR